jgi:hypothetical protein
MKKFLLLFGLTVASFALAQTIPPTVAVSWTAPTTNTNGSTITGAITYNLYVGGTGVAPLVTVQQKGITLTHVPATGVVPGTTMCFAVTAVVGGVESAQTTPVCTAITPTPGIPTKLTVGVR